MSDALQDLHGCSVFSARAACSLLSGWLFVLVGLVLVVLLALGLLDDLRLGDGLAVAPAFAGAGVPRLVVELLSPQLLGGGLASLLLGLARGTSVVDSNPPFLEVELAL